MADEGKVPVRESVGAALRFWRENVALIARVAAISALATAVLSVLAALVPASGILIWVASTFVSACVYAAFIGGALNGPAGVAQRAFADGGRVWAAMAVVAFFLLIVFVVLAIPGFIVLGVLLAPRYGEALQAATGDDAASVALMERIGAENPGMLLGFMLFYGLIWLMLTSRLFLAAPASVDNKRILTFETWSWTKDNMFRILGARLILLAPCYVLVGALRYIFSRGLGMDAMNPASVIAFAQANVLVYALFVFVTGFVQAGLVYALEAGLASYLYRGLKQSNGVVG